jgi:hypothetical protein
MHTQKGFAFPAVIIILGLILVGGIGYAVMKKPMGNEMENTDTMMHDDGMKKDVIMEHGTGTMMKTNEMMKGSSTGTMMMGQGTGTMMKKEDTMMKKEDAMMDGGMMYKGAVLAGKASPLLDFNKADYDTAVKSGKLVTLYFYANWCPLCKAEFPKISCEL